MATVGPVVPTSYIQDPRMQPATQRSRPQYQQPPTQVQAMAKPQQPPQQQQQAHGSSYPDPYYGHGNIARLCARFITHLFACPERPPVPTTAAHAKLSHFIAYALHRTKLHQSVTFAALVLLQRLKARFPTARGSSGHRLFLSAFMLASKVMCDDTYSNKSWVIVGQNIFALREVNQMEREMCSYLEWELNVEPRVLREFETMVTKDFAGSGPYPTYTLTPSKNGNSLSLKSSVSPPPASAPASSSAAVSTTTAQAPAPPPVSAPVKPSVANIYAPTPTTPDTPSTSYSSSSSPASSVSPATPPPTFGADKQHVEVVSDVESLPYWAMRRKAESALASSAPQSPKQLKGKMFAFASPAVW